MNMKAKVLDLVLAASAAWTLVGVVHADAITEAITGEWNATTTWFDPEKQELEKSVCSVYSTHSRDGHPYEFGGMLATPQKDSTDTAARNVRLKLSSQLAGEVFLTGENDKVNLHKFFDFELQPVSTNTWISKGEYAEDSRNGRYTLQVSRSGTATLTLVDSTRNEARTIVFERHRATHQPQSLWKQSGLTTVVLLLFVGSKIARTYFMTKNKPPQASGVRARARKAK
mmetsp:Transcript_10676/g.32683  ORF Transcript_10676/g.32683 Transcript_10676/m.32683 type:complete len:228 (-) Transcript_10676:216-899(-)